MSHTKSPVLCVDLERDVHGNPMVVVYAEGMYEVISLEMKGARTLAQILLKVLMRHDAECDGDEILQSAMLRLQGLEGLKVEEVVDDGRPAERN